MLTQKQYVELADEAGQLAALITKTPFDLLLTAVRHINKKCADATASVIVTTSSDPALIESCNETAARRAFIEEVAVALTAAKIKIQAAAATYADEMAKMQAPAQLVVPSGKVTLT